MRRGLHTHYTHAETLVYEYMDKLFVIDRCQQGITLNPAHGTRQRGSEDRALRATFPIDCSSEELGAAILESIETFDSGPPCFEQWENNKLGKMLANWLGARSYSQLEKGCRKIQIVKNLESGTYDFYAYDNNNINPWHGPIKEETITLFSPAKAIEVGETAKKSFALSTYHPQRP